MNSGFESGLTPWIALGSESLATSTTAQTGAKGLWVTNRTADWQGVAQSLLGRLRTGASYSCSAWVRAEATTSQPLRLTFEQSDGAGTRYFPVASTTVTNNTWTFLSGNFSLNVTGALTELKFYVEGPAIGVELRVDNVSVVPLSGLRLAAGQRTVRMGGISESQVNTDLPFGRVAAADYQIAGTENSLKFSATEPSSNTFSYGSADAILDHATANGQVSRGHTLIWHGDVPGWVSNNAGTWTPGQFQAIAYNHIDKVVAHYRDRLFCWDVVNEAFNDNGTLRSTIWYNAPGIGYAGQGTKYLEELFKRARSADADCELIYNDYDAETVNTKSDAIFAMAQDFKTRGVPLDGIGFQFHLNGTPSLSSMRANFQRFNDLGLNLHITEMDVRVPVDANGVATASALATQGDTYFSVVGTALAYPRTTVVQTWGFSDRYSWIPSYFSGYGAALPLDKNLNRKPAWWALHNVLANQAETLTVVGQSAGDTTTPTTDTSFSAGSARLFQANAANDFITLAAAVPYTGEYNVRVGVRKNNASGLVQCAATGSPGGAFTNIGTTQDTYASSVTYAELNLGNFTFTGVGTNQFRFTVTGKNGSSSGYDLALDYLRLTPTGAGGNQPPALTPLPDQVVTTGANVGPLAFGVSDRETVESALTTTVSSSNTALIPTGNITITGGGSERVLVATPVANMTGNATITVTVTDAAGASSSGSFNVNVGAVNLPPTINSGQTANGTQSQTFSYAITATNSPTSWALSSGSLPAGVTLNTTTGVISGVPTVLGSFSPLFTATNGKGTSTAQSVTVTITGMAVPVITPNQNASGVVGTSFTYAIIASNSPTTWALASGVLPGGVSLDTSTGVLAGIPSSSGSFTPSFTATNSGGTSNSVAMTLQIATAPTALAYEGFNQTDSSQLSGASGGSGWISNWSAQANRYRVSNPGSLTYANLVTSGGFVEKFDQPTFANGLSRSFAPQSGRVWASALINFQQLPSYFEFKLNEATNVNWSAKFGINGSNLFTEHSGSGATGTAAFTPQINQTYLFVFTYDATGASPTGIYVNPNLGVNSPVNSIASAVFAGSNWSMPGGIGQISMYATDGLMKIDEVRIGTSFAEVTPILVNASGIVSFRTTYGLAADGSQDTSSPAGDGIANLLKFAFNMLGNGTGQASSLTVPNTATILSNGIAGLPRGEVDANGKLRITYIRRKNSSNSGITYTVEYSNTLAGGAWSSSPPGIESITSIDSTFERVVVTESSAATARRFGRLRVACP
ncbi:MAG: endo-1,4-beta-xylanase [Luteolibacter sp.]